MEDANICCACHRPCATSTLLRQQPITQGVWFWGRLDNDSAYQHHLCEICAKNFIEQHIEQVSDFVQWQKALLPAKNAGVL